MKRMIQIVCGLIVTAMLFLIVNNILILKRSDGITPMKHLYAQDSNTVDVLILGSSHAGMNLDASVLWQEHGIASFSLWGSVQPFWNSYHFLVEALKTQTPQVVVLEVYAASFDFEYSDNARQVTNVCGMNFNWNRWEAVRISAPSDRHSDLFWGLPVYHARYGELTKNDFEYFQSNPLLVNNKGTGWRYGVGEFALEDASTVTHVQPIYEKEEVYLRKIIELCQKEQIPIVLIKTPTTNRIHEQPFYNAVQQIADEYSISFINYNLMDQETGLTSNDYWTDGHLNTNGARKITKELGEFLVRNYELKDRRKSEQYKSWHTFSGDVQNQYLKQITQCEDYFLELASRDMAVFIVKNSGWPDSAEYTRLLAAMETIGVKRKEVDTGGGDWILHSTQGGLLENQYFGNMYSEFLFNNVIFSADFATGTGIRIDGEIYYKLNGSGFILLVYDKIENTVVDVVTFLEKDGFQLCHVT